jgi:D-alanyl-D-alanine carboxypeptidase/D-alanyl-D-alanine-endopeptidase (penicillin-binding protein 4)
MVFLRRWQMLDFSPSVLITTFFGLFGFSPPPLTAPIPLLAWQDAPVFQIPTDKDAQVEVIVNNYLERLARKGFPKTTQNLWIQSDWAELANHRGEIPSSAASLTKVATSLGSLVTWDLEHRFTTRVYTRGEIVKGVLQGDLVVEGGGDPMFVWEEAIALAHRLESLGLKKVTGKLIVTGNFKMNFREEGAVSGESLRIALNHRLWPRSLQQQFTSFPANIPKPQLEIFGRVEIAASLPPDSQLFATHQSLTVLELLKQMNIYSNNFIAESLAASLGGSDRLKEIVQKHAQVSPQQLQLINGSGLGVDNRLAPQAVCEMFIALERQLQERGLNLSAIFPVGGQDKLGTMQWRAIPEGVAIKTGTLARVSALAGVIPTQERGLVCFAVINAGSDIEGLRSQQDQLLQDLAQHWTLAPIPNRSAEVFLGDSQRND